MMNSERKILCADNVENIHELYMPCDSLYVVMPFYNASATLPRAVLSLQCIEPTNRSRVCLVGIDDGSTDESADVFSSNASGLEGIRWVKLAKRNGGSGSARNEGLRLFSSGWVLFLDADDELIADPFVYLDRSSRSSAVLFGTVLVRGDKVLNIFKPHCPGSKDLPRIFTVKNPFNVLSVIFRRESLTIFFDEDLKYLEDWHFFAANYHLFESCKSFSNIILGRINCSPNSKSSNQYNNGLYRMQIAEKFEHMWSNILGETGKNNLDLQKSIARIQMGERGRLYDLLHLPATPTLLLKLVVYALFYKAYLHYFPYRK